MYNLFIVPKGPSKLVAFASADIFLWCFSVVVDACSKDLYDIFYKEQHAFFKGDPHNMSTFVCKPDYFFKVWAESFPRLRLKPKGDFMHCSICTLLKERLHGTPGAKSNQTDAQRAETRRR